VKDLVDPTRVNVFFTRDDQWLKNFDADSYGYNCYQNGAPNVVFLREKHALATLAHELGHGLYLDHAGFGFLLTDFGWTQGNVMQSSAFDPDHSVSVGRFSLGQVYRANFHKLSWLNKGGIRPGLPKVCQDVPVPEGTTVNWPCPQLTLDRP
jgi:hypothetical protein